MKKCHILFLLLAFMMTIGLSGCTVTTEEGNAKIKDIEFTVLGEENIPEELKQIVIRSGDVLGVETDDAGALEIAKRSRGTPRLANRLLKRCRDFAQVCHNGCIDYEVAKTALDKLEVDSMGLDNTDRNILMTMIEKFGGGPVGLDTLAAAIGEDSGTIEDVYEPYLIKNGFINRTPRGRVVTERCYKHFGLDAFIE